MMIEDNYLGHEHVYFDSSKGDTVILSDGITDRFIAKEQVQCKTWDKVFIKTGNDTIEILDWIKRNAINITYVESELK
jgi:hypothetical protein